MNKAVESRFVQTKLELNGIMILAAADELFNHVDTNLPMWSQDGDRMVEEKITFTRGFAEVPCVTLGLTGIDAAHDQNLRCALQAVDVTKEGFVIKFATWGDTHIARASASWQAIGKAKPDIVKASAKLSKK